MKIFISVALVLISSVCGALGSGMPVIDAAALAANRLTAARDYLEQINQSIRLIEQIRQIDSYLTRFGDPGSIRNVAGMDELVNQLRTGPALAEKLVNNKPIEEDEVFRSLDSKANPGLQKEIALDGDSAAATRDGNQYLPEVAERRAQEQYRIVRDSVLARRETLRKAVASTIARIQQATTASEVQKLGTVLTGIQTEIEAADRELLIALNNAQALTMENATEREILRKGAVERDRASFRIGGRKDAQVYQLLTAPISFTTEQP